MCDRYVVQFNGATSPSSYELCSIQGCKRVNNHCNAFRMKFTGLNVFIMGIYVVRTIYVMHNNVIKNDKRIVISGSRNILNASLKHHIIFIMKDSIQRLIYIITVYLK